MYSDQDAINEADVAWLYTHAKYCSRNCGAKPDPYGAIIIYADDYSKSFFDCDGVTHLHRDPDFYPKAYRRQ